MSSSIKSYEEARDAWIDLKTDLEVNLLTGFESRQVNIFLGGFHSLNEFGESH